MRQIFFPKIFTNWIHVRSCNKISTSAPETAATKRWQPQHSMQFQWNEWKWWKNWASAMHVAASILTDFPLAQKTTAPVVTIEHMTKVYSIAAKMEPFKPLEIVKNYIENPEKIFVKIYVKMNSFFARPCKNWNKLLQPRGITFYLWRPPFTINAFVLL